MCTYVLVLKSHKRGNGQENPLPSQEHRQSHRNCLSRARPSANNRISSVDNLQGRLDLEQSGELLPSCQPIHDKECVVDILLFTSTQRATEYHLKVLYIAIDCILKYRTVLEMSSLVGVKAHGEIDVCTVINHCI